jgi:hypothetical protein
LTLQDVRGIFDAALGQRGARMLCQDHLTKADADFAAGRFDIDALAGMKSRHRVAHVIEADEGFSVDSAMDRVDDLIRSNGT